MSENLNRFGFTHLHVHTEYSLLDGSIRIKDLISNTKELGMDAIAITDHGSMYGVIEFYKEAKKQGIKPIIGSEVYVAINNHLDREKKDQNAYHLILLAENEIGYKNLMKLVSIAAIDGYYYRPRIDLDLLEKYSEGLIGLSACLSGEVPRHLLNDDYEGALKIAKRYEKILGKGNFFLELQDYGLETQKKVNRGLIKISKETNIPLIATNDVHYLKKESAEVHDVLLCIQTGTTVDEEDRMKFPADEFYLKSPREMELLFSNYTEALKNTGKIAERCNVEIDFNSVHLPKYDLPEGYTNEEYLKELTIKGLKERYGQLNDEIIERFNFEFQTIVDMGYVDYFLIVWDFIKFAKTNNIEVGPGRGSAAGSIISYGLGIIDIDPLKYGLIFERFLNPERVSMPDIDIDFCYERREEVIDYVIKKYGKDRVAQIGTFGTMAARGSIRDVGRVINMPYNQVDQVAKEIPMELNITIDKALKINSKLNKMYKEQSEITRLIDYAKAVEGLPRHTSTHAAGVLISKDPVTNYVPLSRNKDSIITQFDMNELEEMGLLKMDFLGLRTLTVIRDTLDLIKENHDIEIKFDRDFKYDDPKVFQLFAKAETLGVFQFESSGMRSFLKELKPDKFEDLIAANSLYRPGPMDEIPTFVKRKHDPSKIEYIHPALEPILKDTYGVIVYQEQVMEIVRKIGGYSLGHADIVRRAMGKLDRETMIKGRNEFIYGELDEEGEIITPGAIRNGIEEKTAQKIYDLMVDFADYAFNKSHSAAYAVVAYRTAYLKYYYPAEFMASLISSKMGDSSSVSLYIHESKRLGIEVLQPDINKSRGRFTVEDGDIRFGLSAVKNVGTRLIEATIKAREDGEFTTLSDYIERTLKVDSTSINKRAIESLIKSGAMDSLEGNRAQLLSIHTNVIDSLSKDNKRNLEGQVSLFESQENIIEEKLPDIKDFPKNIKLSMEKELVGIYVSGHPLENYANRLEVVSNFSTIDLNSSEEIESNEIRDNMWVKIGGIITEVRTMMTRKNQMMAFLTLEDLYGEIELIAFPLVYEKFMELIYEDSLVVIEGRLSISEVDEAQILIDKISELKEESEEKLYLKLKTQADIKIFDKVKSIIENFKGNIPVIIYFSDENKSVIAEDLLWVDNSDYMIDLLKDLLGEESVKLK